MAAMMIAAIEGFVCETWSEYTWLLVVFELVLLCLDGAGAENEFHFTVSETSGPGAENELSDHETDLASRGQVRRPAHPVGIGHAPLFQKTKEDKKFFLEFFWERCFSKRGKSWCLCNNFRE